MSANIHMKDPICLIENRNGHEFLINAEAEEILSQITDPVVVVVIVGKYRTGKSYLMNKLAGSKTGFQLGSTIQSKTKGIWMWCVPHPRKPSHTLVLLDTEGLGDIEKGDSKNDAWIFSLAVLLSSNLVYNSMGTIDNHAMEQLHYVTNLTNLIKLKTNPEGEEKNESSEFKRIFPSFTWCVRDFSLALEIDEKEITEDEYLMNSLRLKKGTDKKIQDYNLPRECILHYFHSHKCFVFDRPSATRNLRRLEELEERDLEKEFVEQTQKFCDYIHKQGIVKTLPGGLLVTGRMLAYLVNLYLETIKSGSVPCIENAVLALSVIENTGAVQDALKMYETCMNDQVAGFPTETLETFLQMHQDCEKEALKVFLKRSFNDENQKFQQEFKVRTIDGKMKEFSTLNENKSTEHCQIIIQQLSAALDQRISQRKFLKPGGYMLFLEEKRTIMAKYDTAPNKGLKSLEVLQEFMNNLKVIEATILQADESLTAKEKQIAESQAEAEAAKRQRQILEEQARSLQESLENQKKSYEQHEKMLIEKMESDRRNLIAENERMIDQKLQEQSAMLTAGHQSNVNALQGEINGLKGKNRDILLLPCVIS
ncbi:guanylate-binding protein 1 [Xenopus laevis]|uniref:Guanylate-binding protein 1 n=2 Tax=Xenopus laevis TaxID=8355 RepID=A0A8J1LDS4_XENLA|nr:guanylate-binding protein 1 [Xenopus laevis]